MGLISQTFKKENIWKLWSEQDFFSNFLTIYGHCGNIGHVSKAICLLLSTTLQTPKKAPQKIGSDLPIGLREEHNNIQIIGAGPTTSLGQCFGENLVIFCNLSTWIHVTNEASNPYHLDDSIFNYRGIKSHISFYYSLRCKSTEGYGVFVVSHHYLMVSFVRQRNNLMVKKNTDHYLSIYAYFLYLQNGYYIKNWLFTKNNWHFCYRRKETSFHC